ncbi:LacI family DNA-binding transcriptional regulator [Galactobacter sp.]|uniref:LacI family DNA-binding transcriptional regulator n=1 Tax=Galactobacter sp. TaxID=2676125 RepID=UPI0025C040E5|nr:LacI family DNA-binding transcriptional regulator [Galactobacter sp.]
MKPEPSRSSPTIDDVASQAGLSRSTVSRALGGYGHVSAKARERIEAAAQALNYNVNMAAKSTRTGRSMTLGLVVADLGERFFAEVAHGFADAARESGYQVVLANTDDDVDEQAKAVQALLGSRVDGLAVAPAQTAAGESAQADVRSVGVPVVAIDRRVSDDHTDVVRLNSEAAAHMAVSQLLRAGHRRIGVVTGRSVDLSALEDTDPAPGANTSPGTERLRGYVSALNDYDVAPDSDLILRTPRALEEATAKVTQLLSRPDRPTALFASDELHCLAALLGAQQAGLSVPGDLSLVGIDDPEWAAAVATPLSVVAQPSYDVGRIAAQRLLERIGGEDSPPREDLMDYTWIQRKSIAAPPARLR